GLVHVLTLAANGFGEIAMLVPTWMIELNETDIALSQAASEQTIGGKGARILGLLAVKLEDAFRLFRKVHDLGDASLHAICHLVLSDALIDLRVAEVLGLKGMQLGQAIEELAAAGGGNTVRILEKEHRIFATAELDSLMDAGQKTIAPKA